jgi:hypothetical protein
MTIVEITGGMLRAARSLVNAPIYFDQLHKKTREKWFVGTTNFARMLRMLTSGMPTIGSERND